MNFLPLITDYRGRKRPEYITNRLIPLLSALIQFLFKENNEKDSKYNHFIDKLLIDLVITRKLYNKYQSFWKPTIHKNIIPDPFDQRNKQFYLDLKILFKDKMFEITQGKYIPIIVDETTKNLVTTTITMVGDAFAKADLVVLKEDYLTTTEPKSIIAETCKEISNLSRILTEAISSGSVTIREFMDNKNDLIESYEKQNHLINSILHLEKALT